MARKIEDVPTEELLADYREVDFETKQRIEKELVKRGVDPNPPAQSNIQQTLPPEPEYSVGGFLSNIGPSAVQTGGDMLRGAGNLIMNPVGTIAGMPGGIAEHYGSRYNSFGQAGDTVYNDPVGAMMDVPIVGTAMRGLSLAGKVGLPAKYADALSTTGKALEKVDPFGVAVGGAQMGLGAVLNKLGSTPRESMAGTYYGQPKGAQNKDYEMYLDAVETAIDEGIEATWQGTKKAEEARKVSGETLGGALQELGSIDAVPILAKIQRLIKESEGIEVRKPYNKRLRQFEADLKRLIDEQGFVDAQALNSLKSQYDSTVNYGTGTSGKEVTRQEGAYDATKAVREVLSPKVADELGDYQNRVNVDDIVRRGARQDLLQRGAGFSGDLFRQVMAGVAPVLTGQNRLTRMRGRQLVDQGRLLEAANLALDVSLYGKVREGMYLTDMGGQDETWHVGRLWNDEDN